MARDLNAFFKIANVINSTRDVQALQRELLELICEVIPAAQAAIVLQPNANEEASPPCTWSRKGLPPQEMAIRKELVQQATWERCAVFTSDSGDITITEHVLCVPLVAVEKILGVIYLSSPFTSPPFGEDHAYFLSSVSRIAAVTPARIYVSVHFNGHPNAAIRGTETYYNGDNYGADSRRLAVYMTASLPVALAGTALLAQGRNALPPAPAALIAFPLSVAATLLLLPVWYLCRALPVYETSVSRLVLTHAGGALLTGLAARYLGGSVARLASSTRPGAGIESSYEAQSAGVMAAGALVYLLAVSFHYVLLGVEATRRGRGLPFIAEVSRIIWGGDVVGWHDGSHLGDAARRADLDLAAMDAAVTADPASYDAELERNARDLEAAGHWGVPTMVFEGEPFFGQDRLDLLVWRMKQHGLRARAS